MRLDEAAGRQQEPAQAVAAAVREAAPVAIGTLQQGIGNRSFAATLGTSARSVQRDAGAKQKIADAVKKPDPDAKGEGFTEAFKILNGLAMFDMLSTLTALKRSGEYGSLQGNWGFAKGVNVERLQLAFLAVDGKGSVDPEKFVFQYGQRMMALPLDQRRDIIEYLDPKWFDSLKAEEDGDKLIVQIKAHAVYAALDPDPKKLADEIMAEGRKKLTKFVYYMEKLKLLFDTPRKDPTATAAETRTSTESAGKAETKRVTGGAAKANTGAEEKKAGAKGRKWTPMPGKFGGTFYVDRTDPNDIVVRATVFLQPAGTGTVKDVNAIKAMEDGIEKAASTKGYTVDVVFVNSASTDAFTVGVDPSKWEVADNWSGGAPKGFAHELHHLMAFELDRYDYIEAHAANEDMDIPDRLHWFRQELDKPEGYNDPTSIMNDAEHPNDDDVCRVAGLDLASCVAARRKKAAARR
jgi:hypothetical protein